MSLTSATSIPANEQWISIDLGSSFSTTVVVNYYSYDDKKFYSEYEWDNRHRFKAEAEAQKLNKEIHNLIRDIIV
jgi:hypothetical protein